MIPSRIKPSHDEGRRRRGSARTGAPPAPPAADSTSDAIGVASRIKPHMTRAAQARPARAHLQPHPLRIRRPTRS